MGLKGIVTFAWKTSLLFVIAILIILLLPNVPPYVKISKSIRLPKTRPLEGPLSLNDKLKDSELLHKGKLLGPEAFAHYNGELYTGVHGGNIVKLVGDKIIPVAKTGKPCKGYYEEHICGRPLGMKFDKNGNMIVADAYYGIFKINIKTGDKELIISPDVKINGKQPKLFNSVALASNGDIYWTDSSQFPLNDILFDVLADPSGRLIHYDAKTKTNRVLIDNLHFTNGVALFEDDGFVIVSETMHSKLHRYHLKGPKKGTQEVLIDALPGLPDNLSSDGGDGLLVPLIETCDDEYPHLVHVLSPFPRIRKALSRLLGLLQFPFEILDRYHTTEFTQKVIHHIGHLSMTTRWLTNKRTTVLHISKSGELIGSFHTYTNKKISQIGEAHIFDDYLYLGSPSNDYIARVPIASLGLPKAVPEEVLKQRTIPKSESTTPTPVKSQTTPPPKSTTTSKPQTTQPPKSKTEVPKSQTTQTPKPQPAQVPKPQVTKTTSAQPTQAPKTQPSQQPTQIPETKPKQVPQTQSTQAPKTQPSQAPKTQSTQTPKTQTTQAPKAQPAQAPTTQPTQAPKTQPTQASKAQPTQSPKAQPTQASKAQPTQAPKAQPTQAPKAQPTQAPKAQPTEVPKKEPTVAPKVPSQSKQDTDSSKQRTASTDKTGSAQQTGDKQSKVKK